MCKQWQILVSWAPRITADGDCGHENKRHLFLGRKAMTNLDITLLTIVLIVIAVICPVVIYRCESWTIKKTEHWRTHAFKLWCWRRLWRVPWTTRRPNQSILKEINPEYWLEGLMLKLKLQYLGHMMWRANSLKKDPDAGKDGKQEDIGTTEDEMAGWHLQVWHVQTQCTSVWANSGRW